MFEFFVIFIYPLIFAIIAVALYFIIKLAVKNAIKELKDKNVL